MFGSSSPLEDVNTISPDKFGASDDCLVVTTPSICVNMKTSDRRGASYDYFAFTSTSLISTNTISLERFGVLVDCLAVPIPQKV